MVTRRVLLLLVSACIIVFAMAGGNEKPALKNKTITVAFYNVENLFDTEDDPLINDQEFLPNGTYQWTQERLKRKLENLSRAIDKLGDEDGPEILGLCEVENRGVLEMLVRTELLKKKGYEIAHADSPDERGIDCALIYKSKRFLPLYQKAYPVIFPDNPQMATRDIFLVKGILDKKVDVTFVVNHWPSRRDGQNGSDWKRENAASVLRAVVDSIISLDPYANLVLMGDFNDEPADKSLNRVLKAGRDSVEAVATWLYNCMAPLKQEGLGTLKFKGEWNLFDQIVVSVAMIHENAALRFVPGSAGIYRPDWMSVQESGDWNGAPRRSYISKHFKEDGFSDHFPVYISLEY